MKWEELTSKERNAWEEIAEKYQLEFQLFKILMEKPTCFMCRFKNPKEAGAYNFHLKSTHGFTLDDILKEHENV